MTPDPDVNARHELRTPIKMILGFCEALLNPTQALPASNRADVEAIYRNAQQLAALIDNVTINTSHTEAVLGLAQVIVLDENGAIYELFREYISSSHIIRVSSAEEIGRLGSEIKPITIVARAEDDKLIPLLTQLVGKDIPILTVNLQTPQSQPDFLMKPVQFNELEGVLQHLGSEPHEVLIVDDNRDNVDLLSRMLASLPQPPRILKAFSGREALALLNEQSPNLILMDFVLPDMDGLAIRDYLSLDSRLAQIPLVFVSAHRRADIIGLGGASKLSLFQMSGASPLRLAEQIRALLATFTSAK